MATRRRSGSLTIGVNGQDVGTIHPVATNALRYNTDKGVWHQYVQKFDASLLKPGENSSPSPSPPATSPPASSGTTSASNSTTAARPTRRHPTPAGPMRP